MHVPTGEARERFDERVRIVRVKPWDGHEAVAARVREHRLVDGTVAWRAWHRSAGWEGDG